MTFQLELLHQTLAPGNCGWEAISLTGIRNNALILLFLADIVCGDKIRYHALDFYVENSNEHSWSWSNLFFQKKIFCTFTMQLKCGDVSSKNAPVQHLTAKKSAWAPITSAITFKLCRWVLDMIKSIFHAYLRIPEFLAAFTDKIPEFGSENLEICIFLKMTVFVYCVYRLWMKQGLWVRKK